VKQGTEEWLNARKGVVTGSRVGAILGLNPWQKKEDVLREMVREHHGAEREFQGNEATRWGTEHEADGINYYEHSTGNIVQHHGLIVHPDYDWIGYSPDGTTRFSLDEEDNTALIEVKCPFSQKIPESIPEHYMAQVQLGMEVMGLVKTHFIYWTPLQQMIVDIPRDWDWFDDIKPKLREFIEEYVDNLDDDRHLQPKIADKSLDPDWIALEMMYRDALKKQDDARIEIEFLKKKMIAIAGEQSARGTSFQLIRSERQGSVNNKSLYKEFHIADADLDRFRGKPSTVFTVREIK